MKEKIRKHIEKLDLLWRITNFISKKHCKDKLAVKKILISKKSRGKRVLGSYSIESGHIWIKDGLDTVCSIKILLHELAHAYQITFYNKQYGQWVDFNKKEVGGIGSGQYDKIMHDVIFDYIVKKFLKSIKERILLEFKD